MKEKKLTLSGDIDPVKAVSKLRKFCHTEVVSVGPSKPKEEKKSEDKPFEGYPFYYHVQQPQYIQDFYYI
jgi:3'-phosphoadenosine 5'-phosphosulfate sulfotransferase